MKNGKMLKKGIKLKLNKIVIVKTILYYVYILYKTIEIRS